MDLPLGAIMMWYRPISEIPAGWILCDGNNGSPDLRGRYVVGVGTDVERVPMGAETHSHGNVASGADGGHVHDVTGSLGGTVSGVGVSNVGSGERGIGRTHGHVIDLDLMDSGTHVHANTGLSTNIAANNPPFMQLFFIMRIL